MNDAPKITIDYKRDGRKTAVTFTRPDGRTRTETLPIADAAARQAVVERVATWLCDGSPETADCIMGELERIAAEQTRPKTAAPAKRQDENKPPVPLPGGEISITQSAEQLGGLLDKTGRHFVRSDELFRLDGTNGERSLTYVKPAAAASEFEQVASLYRRRTTKDGYRDDPDVCSEQDAKVITASDRFKAQLSPISVVSPCALLVERSDGTLVPINGYDRTSGVLASGDVPDDMSIDEALRLIKELFDDTLFASDSDRSRALAFLVTPALVFGHLFPDRAPLFLVEATESQSGKSFLVRLVAAVYSCRVHAVVQRTGGVGSLEESIGDGLVKGKPFIGVDNAKGKINLPSLESMMTEPTFSARVPYRAPITVDTTRTIFSLTSNGIEVPPDTANRSLVIRLRKQASDYRFKRYPEGNILAHVAKHPAPFLGAVFRVVREWHRLGKPSADPIGYHDFRSWTGIAAYIVQNILNGSPLLDGHEDIQRRTATPALNWLRDVSLVVQRARSTVTWLRPNRLFDLLVDDGTIEVPGMSSKDDPDDDRVREAGFRAIGRKIGTCFKDGNAVEIDGVVVERRDSTDCHSRRQREYLFRLATPRTEIAQNTNIPEVPEVPNGGQQCSLQKKNTSAQAPYINVGTHSGLRDFGGTAGNADSALLSDDVWEDVL